MSAAELETLGCGKPGAWVCIPLRQPEAETAPRAARGTLRRRHHAARGFSVPARKLLGFFARCGNHKQSAAPYPAAGAGNSVEEHFLKQDDHSSLISTPRTTPLPHEESPDSLIFFLLSMR